MYFKACTKDLTGYGGFQFEIGKTYIADDTDDWRWFHYAKSLTQTLRYYHEPDTRFLEVTPLGNRQHFVTGDINYWTTNRLQIVREIPREEVYNRLLAEKCPLWLIEKMQPPFEVLLHYKSKLRGDACISVLRREDLNLAQKDALLPKKYYRSIRAFPYRE